MSSRKLDDSELREQQLKQLAHLQLKMSQAQAEVDALLNVLYPLGTAVLVIRYARVMVCTVAYLAQAGRLRVRNRMRQKYVYSVRPEEIQLDPGTKDVTKTVHLEAPS